MGPSCLPPIIPPRQGWPPFRLPDLPVIHTKVREAANGTGETLFLEAIGNCIYTIRKELPFEDGGYTISNSDFNENNEQETQESCEIEIKLERRKAGIIDTEYSSGIVYGGVRKSITIRLDP